MELLSPAQLPRGSIYTTIMEFPKMPSPLWGKGPLSIMESQTVLGTVMGDISPDHHSNSYYRNPTFYYKGTLDTLGVYMELLGYISLRRTGPGTARNFRRRASDRWVP